MNEHQLKKLDALKDRLLQEYTMNGETDEYKKIIKKVVEIGSRMIHSAMTDISTLPRVEIGFDKILEQIEGLGVAMKSLERKVDDGLNHRLMGSSCKLETEKLIYEVIKKESDESKKTISFAFEVTKFILYVIPVVTAVVWATMHIKGG